MLAAILHGQNDLQIEEVPKPQISPDEVLLRCKAVSICGTDMRIYRFGHKDLPDETKRILGHELAGEVAEVGQNVKGTREGTRVAVAPNFGCGICKMCQRGWFHLCPDYGAIGLTVDGGMAEYVRIPKIALQQGCLLEMPAGLSFEEAAINEPFACVYNGYTRCPTRPADVVLIVGAGPIGIMHIQMSRLAGAAKIIIADIIASRLKLARRLGADETVTNRKDLVDSVMELTGRRGADVVITACPSPEVQEMVVDLAADHGRVNFFGGLPKGKERINLNSNLIHYKELTITGSHGCCTYHCRKALELQGSKSVDLKPVVTNVFKLSEAKQAMAAALEGKGLKTVLQP
ncbi:MAG: alcohol dehydrogenase catalytic domain-containing protein [Planctomycetota bacterium]|nr:alcohol dehydrogenase catalytic domain-containing protein [Planctomycetota bacterium]